MNMTKFAVDFAITFVTVFVVSLIVTFLYGLIVHGSGVVEWESSVRFAVMLGIALPLIRHIEKKQSRK